jgi:hypothetical protein
MDFLFDILQTELVVNALLKDVFLDSGVKSAGCVESVPELC